MAPLSLFTALLLKALDIDWRGTVFAVGVGRVFEQPHLGEDRIYERDRGAWSPTNRLMPPPGRVSEGFIFIY